MFLSLSFSLPYSLKIKIFKKKKYHYLKKNKTADVVALHLF